MSAALAFLAAFTSFSLELWFAKSMLPRLGGSAAVWMGASTLFQALLVGAYVWARGALRRPRLAAGLLALPLPALALGLSAAPRLPGRPVLELLAAFVLAAAAPFFLLSATVVSLESAGEDGGPLYAASNAGAFAALAAYPLVLEPLLPLDAQRLLLLALYAACAALAVSVLRGRGRATEERAEPSSAWDVLLWLLLAAAPAAATLATTNLLSMDFAAVPLLWTVPLGVYLLTFVLCFKREPWSPRRLDAALLGFFALSLCAIVFSLRHAGGLARALDAAKSVYLLFAQFTVCLVLHRSLAAARPPAGRAGAYFAWSAAGGALGGAAVTVGVPLLGPYSASTSLDWAMAGSLAAAALAWRDRAALRAKPLKAAAFAAVAALAAGGLVLSGARPGTIESRRTFYGSYSVREQGALRLMFHGNTEHGAQRVGEDPPEPLTYFGRPGPLGQAWRALGTGWTKTGVVGLGTGAIACYGRPGSRMDFFELDPGVTDLARRRFTYLAKSRAAVTVVDGDGRLSLEAADGGYDAIVLDAFSSGAIPVHLLTEEAFALYLARLKPGGVLLLHLSNRWLDLRPAVAAAARDLGLAGLSKREEKTASPALFPSTWAVLARDPKTLAPLSKFPDWTPLVPGKARAWTDRKASLLPLLTL